MVMNKMKEKDNQAKSDKTLRKSHGYKMIISILSIALAVYFFTTIIFDYSLISTKVFADPMNEKPVAVAFDDTGGGTTVSETKNFEEESQEAIDSYMNSMIIETNDNMINATQKIEDVDLSKYSDKYIHVYQIIPLYITNLYFKHVYKDVFWNDELAKADLLDYKMLLDMYSDPLNATR